METQDGLRFLSISAVLIFSTLAGSVARAFDLTVTNNAVITDVSSGRKSHVKAQESFVVNERNPLWIDSPGRVPVLVVPLRTQSGQVKVDSLPIQKAFAESVEVKIDKELSIMLMQIGDIQALLGEKKFSSALQKVSELKTQYPNVRYLDFIEASASFLVGDRSRALSALESGLLAHPDYRPGLQLYKNLGGKPEKLKRQPAAEPASQDLQKSGDFK